MRIGLPDRVVALVAEAPISPRDLELRLSKDGRIAVQDLLNRDVLRLDDNLRLVLNPTPGSDHGGSVPKLYGDRTPPQGPYRTPGGKASESKSRSGLLCNGFLKLRRNGGRILYIRPSAISAVTNDEIDRAVLLLPGCEDIVVKESVSEVMEAMLEVQVPYCACHKDGAGHRCVESCPACGRQEYVRQPEFMTGQGRDLYICQACDHRWWGAEPEKGEG